jgi:hypothetical protein
MDRPTDLDIPRRALEIIDELIRYQQQRVLALANRIQPGLTDEDLRNPHDFPNVFNDPAWQYEDGQLAGLVSAQVALKSRLVPPPGE